MKKETLEKTLVMLNKEYEDKRQVYSDAVDAFKDSHTIDNFKFSIFESSWQEGELYRRIEFKHSIEDVSFYYENGKGIDRISWASWSYSHFKSDVEKVESLAKSLNYIIAVKEMLELMTDEKRIATAVGTIVYDWNEQIKPIQKAYYDSEREIDDIEKAIRELNSNEEFEQAKEYLVGKIRYTNEWYSINNRNKIKVIDVNYDKKGNFTIIDGNGRKKKIDNYTVISLYNHLTKWNKRKETVDWDKDWDDESRYRFYKYQTEVDSESKMWEHSRDTYIEITKEEFDSIR